LTEIREEMGDDVTILEDGNTTRLSNPKKTNFSKKDLLLSNSDDSMVYNVNGTLMESSVGNSVIKDSLPSFKIGTDYEKKHQ
jgi:hypothetical protein